MTIARAQPTGLFPITAHGLVAADEGKPVGVRTDGKPYVWDEAALPQTEFPLGILAKRYTADLIKVAGSGEGVDVLDGLLPAGLSGGDILFWDKSSDTYTTTEPGDTQVSVESLYYVGPSALSGHSKCVSLLPQRPFGSGTAAPPPLADLQNLGAISGTVNLDWSNGQKYKIATLSGDMTSITKTDPTAAGFYTATIVSPGGFAVPASAWFAMKNGPPVWSEESDYQRTYSWFFDENSMNLVSG